MLRGASLTLRLSSAVMVGLGVGAVPAAAQCPDGSLQVNGRCGGQAARALPPIDPNRLAILPFRTSGADRQLGYLRDGMVELLTAGFNGEVGPTAVEPGEALRAWRRANSGPEPGSQRAALSVARQLGAGQVTYASVVGTPRRFTVTISVLAVPGGSVVVPPIQVEGTEDSLVALVSSIATRLLGRSVGAISTSDEAVRAFNTGMAAYRRGNDPEARAALNRALELDSTFVQAAYRLVVLRALFGPSGPITPLALRTAASGRQRLSAEQRLLLDALVEGDEMRYRSQMLPRLERAIEGLPQSVEAWDVLGDLYLRVGALIGREDWADRAERAMKQAFGLDSVMAISARAKLADLAYRKDDRSGVARYAGPEPWGRYLAALASGNRAAIAAARIGAVRSGMDRGAAFWQVEIGIPIPELDTILSLGQSLASSGAQQRTVATWAWNVANLTGQLSRNRPVERWFPPGDSVGDHTSDLLMSLGLYWERSREAWLSVHLGGLVRPDRLAACEVGLARLRRGDTTGVGAILAGLPRWEPGRDLGELRRGLGQGGGTPEEQDRGLERRTMVCREVLDGALGSFDPARRAVVLRADSVMRFMPLNWGEWWNYDVALALARQGEYAAASRAVRRRWWGISPRRVIALRQEGRWAALAGDTGAAITAYRNYLIWRSNPEPMPPPLPRDALIAQRDSVRAELAALEKSSRKPARPKRAANNPPGIQ